MWGTPESRNQFAYIREEFIGAWKTEVNTRLKINDEILCTNRMCICYCLMTHASYLLASPGLPGEVAAQQTEGVFEIVSMRQNEGEMKKDPLRLTSFGTSPGSPGEA